MKIAKFVRIFLLAGLMTAGSLIASAQSAGYDFFQTGTGGAADLSKFGLGNVPLKGVPIMASAGNTDTIMHRTQNGPGTVAVEVYALFMKNSGAVTFNGVPADVYVTINNSAGAISTSVLPQPDTLQPSQGTVTIFPAFTFDSKIVVNADVIIVAQGASPSGPNLKHGPASSVTLSATASPWSTTPPAGYPAVPSLPSGGFYPVPPGPRHDASGANHHPVVPASCVTTATPASPAKPGATGNAVAIAKCISAVAL